MNIREEILVEHSKRQTQKIAAYIGNNPQRFSELMELFFNDSNRVVQRSATVMNCAVENNPPLIEPYLDKMIDNLNNEGLHDGVKRNTVRLLQFIPIPEDLYGPVADRCFRYLASDSEPIAVKAFSLTVLERICKEIPELKSELRILIEDQLPYSSSGFRNRGQKILKRLRD